jgi:hypothetical protein
VVSSRAAEERAKFEQEREALLEKMARIFDREVLVVAEPLELFQFKCADHRYTGDMISTHFKRNNPVVCRVTSR